MGEGWGTHVQSSLFEVQFLVPSNGSFVCKRYPFNRPWKTRERLPGRPPFLT